MRIIAVLFACLLTAAARCSWAGPILDYLRSYDMNDYALGVSVSMRQNPVIGAENSTIAYPYLTSFTNSAFTDGWLLIRDGGYGIRWVTDNDWQLGVIGRIRTLTFGNSAAEELVGLADRKWTVEVGPTIGWRGWPVHINWTTWSEITDRHEGFTSDLALSLPLQFDRGFIVPKLEASYLSSQYAEYYYSVQALEATPDRPAYSPGSAINMGARVRLGYALTEKWLLAATLGVELLASEITASPIVDRERVWFGTLGLAYNANVFNATGFDSYSRRPPNFEIVIGAFQNRISSKVSRDTEDGVPGFEVDIEDILGAPNEQTVLEMDAIWRVGQHHRLELGYFELARDGNVVLDSDLTFGDETFSASTELITRIDYSSLRLGYTFFLMRDAQKELGVMAGVHLPEFSMDIDAPGTGQRETSRSSAPLPVIGVSGAVFLGEKTTLSARIQLFRTDTDRHEGSLNHAALRLERRFGDSFSVGIGYSFYGMNLTSRDESLNGRLQIRHHGPVAYMTLGL